MELKTSVLEICGSYYVRVPPAFVEFCKVRKTTEAKIEEIDKSKLKVTFPNW